MQTVVLVNITFNVSSEYYRAIHNKALSALGYMDQREHSDMTAVNIPPRWFKFEFIYCMQDHFG